MLKLANRVKETSITSGTGSVLLAGGFGAFQTFSSAIGNGNTTFYTIENDTRWEVGIGTYASDTNTLSRDTVLSSSSGGSKIDLNGVSIVFCTLPAEKTVFFGDNNYLPAGKPLTLTRESNGNFIHAFVDNSSDETVALHMQDSSDPTWKFGLKNTPNSTTTAPQYGYVYGANGTAGLYGDSDAYAYIDANLGFYISHEGSNLVQVTKDGGTEIKNGSANVNALSVKGAAAQSSPLQVWTNNTGTTLSSVGSDGSLALGKATGPDYTLDVNGTANVTTVRFSDGSLQTTASKPSGEFGALSGVVETNKSNIATINSTFMPLSSGDVINTLLGAHNYIPDTSGSVINTAISNVISGRMAASSGDVINTALSNVLSGSIPVSSGYIPVNSGDLINTAFSNLASASTGLPTSSGALINTALSNVLAGSIPVSSGYLPISSGAVINSEITKGVTNYALPITSGGVINDAFDAIVNGALHTVGLGLTKSSGGHIYAASGSIVASGAVMLTNDVTSNPTPSGKAVTPQGVINYVDSLTLDEDNMASDSATSLATQQSIKAYVDANAGSVTVGLGLSKVGSNVFGASGSLVTSGVVMLTNDVSSNPTPSGKAVTPQGVIDYVAANPATVTVGLGLSKVGSNVFGASGSIVSSGSVMLTNDVSSNLTPSGKAVTPQGVINYALPTTSGDVINGQIGALVSSAGLGLVNSNGHVYGASGSLVTSGVVMLTNDVSSNPTPSGKAVTPQGVIDYVAANPATVTVGLGLSKVGSNVFGASGSIVSSGSVMLTNDVSSNLTPSGKAVTPQGVINYALPTTSGDVINGQIGALVSSAGLGLVNSNGHVYGASGSIVSSGSVMLTNDVSSNLTPSGKAVTPQGVINYALPTTSGDVINGQIGALVSSAGLGLVNSNGHVYGASGSIVASGAVMLTNHVTSNPTPSGKAVTPQGVINYVDALTLDEDNMASDSATSLATQQSIKAYVDANAGSVTVGLGLSKVGSNVFGASGSLVTSGVVMLTNDVSSNPTPSGKAVTPQGVVNYAMPASSGHDVLHSVGLGLTKSGGHVYAASGSIVASGALMLTNDVSSNPTPSGKAVTPQGVVNYAMPASSGHDVLHSVGLGLTKSGGHVYAASGSIVASGALMLTNDVSSNPTPSGKAVTPQGVVNYAMPASSGHDVLHSVGLGLTKSGGHVYAASGSIVASGAVMLTNHVTSNPTPSGKAVTPQGVINYAEPIISASNRVPANLIHDGSISNTEFGFLEGIGDNIQGQLNDKVQIAGSGLIKIGTTMHAASGSIVASGALMLTNDVASNPTPSGKAVTPQGVINYVDGLILDEDNLASDSATSLATQQSIKAYVDANAGTVTVGLGLSKVGSNVFGASGSLVTSGVVMLTNDVSSNLTPSGKAVTPQGVINYAMPASSGHDVLHSVGLGLTKSGGHVHAASGSIVASGSVMLTNDVSSNPTPSGKAVTPQGVINYAMPASSGHDVLHSVGLGLTKSGGHVHAASGSIVASGALMLTNDVASNPTPSGKAVTPQGVINYAAPLTVDMIAGDGLTGGGTIASDRTFTVVGGDGITANANDIAITAAQTTVTSIYNSSLAIGYGASHANINFGTDNQITFDIDGAEQVVLKDGVLHPVTDSDVDLGKFDKTWKDAYLDTIQTTSDIICSGEIRTSGIAYLDNDYAMSIADGGAVTFKKAVHYPVVENTQSSATLALDLATGNHFQVNLGANVTAINLANSTLGQRFIIRFTQDGTGSRTVVWNDVDSPDSSNAYVAWAGGSAPTLTTTPGKSDSLGFICTSGIAYFDGYVIGQGM